MKSPWLTACVVAPVAFLWISEAKADEPGEVSPRAADPMRGKEPGEVRDDNGLKLKLVWCPPGFFNMEKFEVDEDSLDGDDPENGDGRRENARPPGKTPAKVKNVPVKVWLLRGYWLGKYEVTQVEWKRIMATEPWRGNRIVKEGDDYPASNTSWNDAVEFCQTLTAQERKAGRLPDGCEYTLPTDAQWERACRARTETRFSFGSDESQIGDYAWWGGIRRHGNTENEQYPHRVGQKKPNPWGLYDMHGNVAEWCRDTLIGAPPGGRDPEVTEESSIRICRGGNWQLGPEDCQCGYRCGNKPDLRTNFLGFRVALSPVRQASPTAPGVEAPPGQ